jgi:hypothetical protein
MPFPTNPSVGDTYVENDTTYEYLGPVNGWYRQEVGPNNDTTYIGSDGAPGGVSNNGAVIFNDNGSLSSDSGLSITSDSYIRLAFGTKGIQFNGDTAAANALDDYEEGTWTPVIADALSGGNVGTGTVNGYYVKIGSLVTLTVSILDINTTGMTAGNDLFIRGLPFAAASLAGTNLYTGALIATSLTAVNSPALALVDGSSYIRIAKTQVGTPLDYMMISEFTSGTSDIYGSISYQAI